MTALIVLPGDPRTKKNSPMVVRHGVIPSKAYREYRDSVWPYLLHAKVALALDRPIDAPLNIKCLYYMRTRRKCDLTNLMEATDDLLVGAGILADDNHRIIVSHDGSRVLYDKENPRCEVWITSAESAEVDQ